MINIDARGCGQGKTTDGIYRRLAEIFNQGQLALIVVPSIKLQKQYNNDWRGRGHELEVINSEIYNSHRNTGTTVAAVITAIKRNRSILITHATWLKMPRIPQLERYHLILDEVPRILQICEIQNELTIDWQPDLDWQSICQFDQQDLVNEWAERLWSDDTGYYRFRIHTNMREKPYSDSRLIEQLQNPNYDHWITFYSWHVLNGRTTGTGSVFSELSADIFSPYKSVWIAAAAIQFTEFGYWLQARQIQHQIVHAFVPHVGNLHIWSPNNFQWSNGIRRSHPEILTAIHHSIRANASGPVLAIRNNDELDDRFPGEIRVKHNVHGMNNLQHIRNVSCESALHPGNQYRGFINQWLTQLDDRAQHEAFVHMTHAYDFYQVLMRTGLRRAETAHEQVNIWLVDSDVSSCLTDYFDWTHLSTHDLNERLHSVEIPVFERKKIGRPTGSKMSDEERQQAREIKRKRDRERIKAKRDRERIKAKRDQQ